ncbi:MAG: MFS transporter [Acidimicrobiia bacterium]
MSDATPPTADAADLIDSRRGWGVVAVAFVAMYTVFGVAYSFGAFFEPMAEEFGASPGATSAVFSITAFLYFLLGSVSGVAVDRYGPRRVLLTGAVVMGGGLVLTGQVGSLWVGYLTYGFGVGIGVACGYVPMVAVVSGWFQQRRGAALGVAVSGIGFGTVATAPLAAALIDRYGWRTTYVVFGLASAAILAACAVAVRPPPTSAAMETDLRSLRDAVRTRSFRALYLSTFLLSLALFVPFVFLVPFAEDRGIGAVAAAALVGVIGGSSIAGRLVIGPLADRVGHLVAFRLCFLLIGASFALWLVGDAYAVLVAFAVVLGVGYGGFVALSPAVIAGLFGTDGLGGLIGVSYTSAALGGLIGPPIAGVVIEATSHRTAIAASMVIGLGSWAALHGVRQDRVRPTPAPGPTATRTRA